MSCLRAEQRRDHPAGELRLGGAGSAAWPKPLRSAALTRGGTPQVAVFSGPDVGQPASSTPVALCRVPLQALVSREDPVRAHPLADSLAARCHSWRALGPSFSAPDDGGAPATMRLRQGGRSRKARTARAHIAVRSRHACAAAPAPPLRRAPLPLEAQPPRRRPNPPRATPRRCARGATASQRRASRRVHPPPPPLQDVSGPPDPAEVEAQPAWGSVDLFVTPSEALVAFCMRGRLLEVRRARSPTHARPPASGRTHVVE